MKICFYADNRGPFEILHGYATARGGAEKQIAHLMKALAAAGHQICLFYGGGKPTDQAHQLAGITCMPLALVWTEPWSLLTFWRQLEQIRPDMIYARLPNDFLWLLGLFAKIRPATQFVYALAYDGFCNPWQTYDHNRWFHNPLYALGLAMANVVLLQHAAQRALVQPYVKGRLVQLPNLVEPIAPTVRNYRDTEFDAIWVAQIRPQKQLACFLDLVESLPHLRFALVGGFTYHTEEPTQLALTERIKRLTNLTYLGLCPAEESRRWIERSKVLVNTSLYEGFPNTMLEAWSVGVPVVSLSIDPGGVIQQNALGLVSGNGQRLREDVKQLAETQQLNQTFGANGLAYVQQQHSLALVCAAFEGLLSESVKIDAKLTIA